LYSAGESMSGSSENLQEVSYGFLQVFVAIYQWLTLERCLLAKVDGSGDAYLHKIAGVPLGRVR
jgi:hypothetical protein